MVELPRCVGAFRYIDNRERELSSGRAPLGRATDAPEAFADALADRLQGLEAGPALGGMKTDALGRAVVNGHEDKG